MVHEGETIEYIEVTKDDIREANRLAHEVLGRTLDELPPQTRRVLEKLDRWVARECERLAMVRADFRFQRSDVRGLGWAHTQARTHLDKLVELEYVVAHRGTRGQSFVYELVYDGQGRDGQPFMMGLSIRTTCRQRQGMGATESWRGPDRGWRSKRVGWRVVGGLMAARWRPVGGVR